MSLDENASGRIPVYQPQLAGNERRYVLDCLDTNWISSKGKYVSQFEQAFADYVGVKHAVSVCNGTVAVHLALLALGLGPGDEVIVPTFTYIASVNPIRYLGATPVFVDSRSDSWQAEPNAIRARITSKTKAIVVVHLYGHAADMGAILSLADEFGIPVIEDCAEALGSTFDGSLVGSFGKLGAFSFYGNKTITTGEGGMVVTNDDGLHEHCLRLRGQGLAVGQVYWHDIVGYNFRMTNVCAAIGLAQLERISEILQSKKELATWYDQELADLPVELHSPVSEAIGHSHWMYSALFPEGKRARVSAHLEERGIETRPTFAPVHLMPMYHEPGGSYPVAEALGSRGLNLPSWPGLKRAQVRYIAQVIKDALSA